jgi:hypothetical protein
VLLAVDDNTVLPFANLLDWSEFSVTIPYAQLSQLRTLLTAIPPERWRRMQRRLREVYAQYFCTTSTYLKVLFTDLQNRILKIKTGGAK